MSTTTTTTTTTIPNSPPAPAAGTPVDMENFTAGAAVAASADYCWGPSQRARVAGGMSLVARSPQPGWAEVILSDGTEQQYRIGAMGAFDLVYGTEAEPQPRALSCQEALRGVAVTSDNFCPGVEVSPGPHWRWGTQHTDNGNDSGVGILLRLDPNQPGWCFVRWMPDGQDCSYRCGHHGATDLVFGREERKLPDPSAEALAALEGKDVSEANALPGATVSRGRNWRTSEYGNQDGGKPGLLSRVHEGYAFVLWRNQVENRYRLARNNEQQQQQQQQQGEGEQEDGSADLCYGSTPLTAVTLPRFANTGTFNLVDRWKSIDFVSSGPGCGQLIGVHSRNATCYSEEVFDATTPNGKPVDAIFVCSSLKAGIVGLGMMRASAGIDSAESAAHHIIGEVEIHDSIGLGIEPAAHGQPAGGRCFILDADQKKYARDISISGATIIHMRVFRGTISFRVDGHPFHCPELAQRRFSEGEHWRCGVSLTQQGQRGFFCSGEEAEVRAKMYEASLISVPRIAYVSPHQQHPQHPGAARRSSTPDNAKKDRGEEEEEEENSSPPSPDARVRRETEAEPVSAATGAQVEDATASGFAFHDFLRSIDVAFDRALICRRSQRATVFSVQVFDAGSTEFTETLTIHGGLKGGDVAFGLCDEHVTADAARFLCGEIELIKSISLLLRQNGTVCFLHRDKLIDLRPRGSNGNNNNSNENEGEEEDASSDSEKKKDAERDIEITLKFSHGAMTFSLNSGGEEEQTFEWSESSGKPRLGGSYRLAVSLTKEGQRASLAGVDNQLVEARMAAPTLKGQEPPAELSGKMVTPSNFVPGVFVSRSEHWKFGDQDGRAPGIVFALENDRHAWVVWPASAGNQNRYRCTEELSDLVYGKTPAAAATAPRFDPSHNRNSTFQLVDRWRSLDCSTRGDITCTMTTNATAYSLQVFTGGEDTPEFSVHLLVTERAKHMVGLGLFRAASIEECSRRMIGEVELEDSIGVGVTEGGEAGGALQMCLLHGDSMHQRTDLVGKAQDAQVILSMYVSRGGSVRFEVDEVPLPPNDTLVNFTLKPGVEYCVGASLIAEGSCAVLLTGELGRERLKVLAQQSKLDTVGYKNGISSFNMIDTIRSIKVTRRAELECVSTRRGTCVSREVFDTESSHFRQEVILRGGALCGGDCAVGVCDVQPSANLAGFLVGESEITGSISLLLRPQHAVVLCDDKLFDARPWRSFVPSMMQTYDEQKQQKGTDKSKSKSEAAEQDDVATQEKERQQHEGREDKEEIAELPAGEDVTISVDVRHRKLSFFINGIPFESVALQQISLRPRMRLAAGFSRRGQRLDFVPPSAVPDAVEIGLLSDEEMAPLKGQPVTRANFRVNAPVAPGPSWRYGNQNRNSFGRLLAIDEAASKTHRAAVATPAAAAAEDPEKGKTMDVVTVAWSDSSKNRYRAGPVDCDLVYGTQPYEQKTPVHEGRWQLVDQWQSMDVSPSNSVTCRYTTPATTFTREAFRPRNHPIRADLLILGRASSGSNFAGLGLLRSTDGDLQLCSETNVGDLPGSIACGVADNRLVMRAGGERLKIGVQPQILFPLHLTLIVTSHGTVHFLCNDVEVDCSALEGETISEETENYRVGVSLSELGDRAFFSPGPNTEKQIRYVQMLPHDLWKAPVPTTAAVVASTAGDESNEQQNEQQDDEQQQQQTSSAGRRTSPPAAHEPQVQLAQRLADAPRGPDAEVSFCAPAAPAFLMVSDDGRTVRHIGPIAGLGPAPQLPDSAKRKKSKKRHSNKRRLSSDQGRNSDSLTNSITSRDSSDLNRSLNSCGTVSRVSVTSSVHHRTHYRDPLALDEGELLHHQPEGAAAPASPMIPLAPAAAVPAAASSAAAKSGSKSAQMDEFVIHENSHDDAEEEEEEDQAGEEEEPAAPILPTAEEMSQGRGSCVSEKVYALGVSTFSQSFLITRGLQGGDVAIGVVNEMANGCRDFLVGETGCVGSLALLLRPSNAPVVEIDETEQSRSSSNSGARLAVLYEDKIIDESEAPFASGDDAAAEPIAVDMHVRQQKLVFVVNGRPFESPVLTGINFRGHFRIAVGLTTEGQRVIVSDASC